MVCSTLARLDLIRVPLPAARTAAKIGTSWCSNTGFYDSYPLRHPCPRGWAPDTTGWGGRIRTCDPGTKTRCLATWPRPIADAPPLVLNDARNACDYTGALLSRQLSATGGKEPSIRRDLRPGLGGIFA